MFPAFVCQLHRTGFFRTIDIQNADNITVFKHRDNDFRLTATIAGNMS